MKGIERTPGVKYVCLAPNMRGAERALECGVDEINLVMSASETHNLDNIRMTREQSTKVLGQIIDAMSGQVDVNISISSAESSVGKECVSSGRFRWLPDH